MNFTAAAIMQHQRNQTLFLLGAQQDRVTPQIVGLEWNKIDDTYLRLQSNLPPLAAAVDWDKVADTYARPERG